VSTHKLNAGQNRSDPHPCSAEAESDAALPESVVLARFPLERNRSSDKKSRQIEKLERVLIAKVCQLLRNSL